MCISKFVVRVLSASDNLRVFKGYLDIEDITSINEKRLNQDAFSNLIALELLSPMYQLLGELTALDQLQLRYLYLWDSLRLSQSRVHRNRRWIDEKGDALNRLLSRQNQLEGVGVIVGHRLG